MGSKVSKKGSTGKRANDAWVESALASDKDIKVPESVAKKAFNEGILSMPPKDAAFIRSEITEIYPLPYDYHFGGEAIVYSGKAWVKANMSYPEVTAAVMIHEAVHAGRGTIPATMPSGRPYLSNVTKRDSKLWRETEVFTTEISLRSLEAHLVKELHGSKVDKAKGVRLIEAAKNQLKYRANTSYGDKSLDANVRKAGCKWDVSGEMNANKDALIQDFVKNGFAGHKFLGLKLAKVIGWKE